MKLLKSLLLLVVILFGSTLIVQAKPVHQSHPTYNETKAAVHTAFLDAMSQETTRFLTATGKVNEKAIKDMEAEIASAFEMHVGQVRDILAERKDNFIALLETEKKQLKTNLLDEYAKEKEEQIHEEIADDMTSFLKEITK